MGSARLFEGAVISDEARRVRQAAGCEAEEVGRLQGATWAKGGGHVCKQVGDRWIWRAEKFVMNSAVRPH